MEKRSEIESPSNFDMIIQKLEVKRLPFVPAPSAPTLVSSAPPHAFAVRVLVCIMSENELWLTVREVQEI